MQYVICVLRCKDDAVSTALNLFRLRFVKFYLLIFQIEAQNEKWYHLRRQSVVEISTSVCLSVSNCNFSLTNKNLSIFGLRNKNKDTCLQYIYQDIPFFRSTSKTWK